MHTYRASHTGIVGLVVIIAAITAGLHSLGDLPALAVDWTRPLVWVDASDPSDVIGALLRYVGLAIGYWVLITTLLYYAVGLLRGGRRPQWVTFITLPPIRRIIDRTLAASLAISMAGIPIGSLQASETTLTETPPVVYEMESDGIPVPHVSAPVVDESGTVEPSGDETTASADLPEPTVEPPVSVSEAPAAPGAVPIPVAPPAVVSSLHTSTETQPGTTYTVERGDNLWSISAAHLGTTIGDSVSADEIDRYWRGVVAVNQGTLRSGDPNLIYPGEIITLPAPEASQ